jgi:hypothetical protein
MTAELDPSPHPLRHPTHPRAASSPRALSWTPATNGRWTQFGRKFGHKFHAEGKRAQWDRVSRVWGSGGRALSGGFGGRKLFPGASALLLMARRVEEGERTEQSGICRRRRWVGDSRWPYYLQHSRHMSIFYETTS